MKIDITEKNKIVSDINIGRDIFEKVPFQIRPYWGELLLSRFSYSTIECPKEIQELSILILENNWADSYNQFQKIRQFLLNNSAFNPIEFIELAEKIAKITLLILYFLALFQLLLKYQKHLLLLY